MSASPKSVCVSCRRVYKGEGRRHTTEQELDSAFRRRGTRPNVSYKGVGYFPKRWMGNGAGMHHAPETCPECREPTVMVGYTWRPPRRTNSRAWKRIARGDWWTER